MSKAGEVAVLGGGNGAFIAAADLSLKGFSVRLCEVPELEQNIEGAKQLGGIHLEVRGNPGLKSGFARLKTVTTDPKEALSGAEIVLIIVPAFAQKRFTEFVGEHLEEGQVVVLMPGNFGGSLEMSRTLKEKGLANKVLFAEVECMIYSGFKESTAKVWASGYKRELKFAAFPSSDTPVAFEKCKDLYPDLVMGVNILETGLSNINTVVHAPILILNSGWVERTGGDFLFYWDGCTESVGSVVEEVEAERQAIGNALGLKLRPAVQILLDWYGHQGASGKTLGEVLRTNPVYQWDTAPKTLKHRFLLEDIPYGMVPMEVLGEITGVRTPTISSIINLSCTLTGTNLRQESRDLRKLGLSDMTIDEVKRFMERGF